MKQIWDDGFFKRPKEEVVNEFLTFIQPYMPKAYLDKMKKRVEELHDYGKLPIKVNALPEGSLIDEKIPVFTVVNTKKQFYWITNYLETWLSANLWKPMVSASIARTYRHIIQEFANKQVFHNLQNGKISLIGKDMISLCVVCLAFMIHVQLVLDT